MDIGSKGLLKRFRTRFAEPEKIQFKIIQIDQLHYLHTVFIFVFLIVFSIYLQLIHAC